MRPDPKRLVAVHLTGLLLAASALTWLGPGVPSWGGSAAPRPDFVATGTHLAPIPLAGADTAATWSPREGEGTLLLVFSEGCSGCEDIATQWRELISFLRPPDSGALPVDVVLLTVADRRGASAFLARHGLQGSLVVADLPSDEHAREPLAVLARVPQTVLIGPDGTVMRGRVGVLEGDELSSWITGLADLVETVAAGW